MRRLPAPGFQPNTRLSPVVFQVKPLARPESWGFGLGHRGLGQPGRKVLGRILRRPLGFVPTALSGGSVTP
jgi:hypothetical protein